MGKFVDRDYNCSSCGRQYKVRLPLLFVPSMFNPRKNVINQNIFEHQCPYCKKKEIISHDILYIDPKFSLAVVLKPQYEGNVYHLNNTEKGLLPASRVEKLRLTTSANWFAEKVNIITSGFNDKIFEVFRVMILVQAQKSLPNIDNLYLYGIKDQEIVFQSLCNGETGEWVRVPVATYDSFAERIRCPEVFDMNTKGDGYEKIDWKWADNDIVFDAFGE